MSDITLDALFATAKAEYAKTHAGKKAASAPTPTPTHWTRGLNIRLLHSTTDAFLGDFSEWLSVKDGARRLVREEDGSIPIHKIERIAGDWGVNTPLAAECLRTNPQYSIIMEVTLEETVPLRGVVDLAVSFQNRAIEAACLETDSSFFDGSGQILELPASFNIYPLLTRTSKIALFNEVLLQHSQES